MTPANKIKKTILYQVWVNWDHDDDLPEGDEDIERLPDLNTDESIDKLYKFYDENDWVQDYEQDYEQDFRAGDYKTDLPCEWSRHYETISVASQMYDGSHCGWTYWYGGGKHGESEAVDWIGRSYDLNCVEEEKLVTVRTFTKI